mmetsp:Transcript_8315/g.19509  ORF Transcript_8315/g.19509 Transcript_8315/m.19509 type:complete len:141 (+) Transcript_8315:53-475(+)|eukprot:CAMPEP_0171093446 /NCGR_PEP_ID=MMETSP0766_2-20121228/39087_1 /TAXON_ID=439317 /ORGANISM="Gambierdiscus australes, Strain CAWD 149" /LENGTH=140 /DNA_ID=CAMNT_0011551895 /DNA_START=50 /DNA_END=472 /DNA_ORIENTATION=-
MSCRATALALVAGLALASAHTCDPLDSCRCLLSCKVYEQKSEQCDEEASSDEINDVVNKVVAAALDKPPKHGKDPECEGLKCIMGCASSLGCLDQGIKANCYNLKDSKESCDVDCNGAHKASGAMVCFAMALMALRAGDL